MADFGKDLAVQHCLTSRPCQVLGQAIESLAVVQKSIDHSIQVRPALPLEPVNTVSAVH